MSPRRRWRWTSGAVIAVLVVLGGCADRTSQVPAAGPPASDLPAVDVTTVADGLDHPWDVVTAPDGTLLTGERRGRFIAVLPGGERREVHADLGDLFARVETGLMGIALATDFPASRKLFTCQGFQGGGVTDVRVVAWTVDPGWTTLTRVGTMISGFPVSTGRHGGCRILPRPSATGQPDTLLIGTGDSAQPTVPQDLESLGGKVLRIDATTGAPAAGNPFGNSPVYTLGHRNVQGLAVRPGTDEVYSIEQGPDRDDEVNLLRAGANYGWKPDRQPNRYDESVPMTDPDRVPGAVPAVWSSGFPTLATASGSFVSGPQWGSWDGALAIGALKASRVVLLRLTPDGRSVAAQTTVPELDGTVGRIRTVAAQPDGSLLVTTDNGGNDRILRVTPRG